MYIIVHVINPRTARYFKINEFATSGLTSSAQNRQNSEKNETQNVISGRTIFSCWEIFILFDKYIRLIIIFATPWRPNTLSSLLTRQMFDQKIHQLSSHVCENDLIACNLLKGIDRYEQFAILYDLDRIMLNRVFDAALLQEEYEICQVISEVSKENMLLEWYANRSF